MENQAGRTPPTPNKPAPSVIDPNDAQDALVRDMLRRGQVCEVNKCSLVNLDTGDMEEGFGAMILVTVSPVVAEAVEGLLRALLGSPETQIPGVDHNA